MSPLTAIRKVPTYEGVEFGAQTTANDSGSIRWKPEWVCRSTEDMKPADRIRYTAKYCLVTRT